MKYSMRFSTISYGHRSPMFSNYFHFSCRGAFVKHENSINRQSAANNSSNAKWYQAATPLGVGIGLQCGEDRPTQVWDLLPPGKYLPSGVSICYPLFPMKRTSTPEDSAPATKADFAELRQLLSSNFEESDKCFDRIEAKLTEHDRRFDDIDRELEEHDKRFDLFDHQFERILEMLYGDKNELEGTGPVISLEGRIVRLERYLGLPVA